MLGYTRGHKPRHAKTYRNFAAEYARLQSERIAAFKTLALRAVDKVAKGDPRDGLKLSNAARAQVY